MGEMYEDQGNVWCKRHARAILAQVLMIVLLKRPFGNSLVVISFYFFFELFIHDYMKYSQTCIDFTKGTGPAERSIFWIQVMCLSCAQVEKDRGNDWVGSVHASGSVSVHMHMGQDQSPPGQDMLALIGRSHVWLSACGVPHSCSSDVVTGICPSVMTSLQVPYV